jgi:hypothetical protein
MNLSVFLEFAKANFTPLTSVATFILGFMVSRWTMTKKERKDVEQKHFENGKELMLAQHEKFQEFVSVLQKYVNKVGDPTFDDFVEIATAGERYFYQQKITSNAILAGNVDAQSRDTTLVPRIAETVNSNLPHYYKTLQSIAQRKGFAYSGGLLRENYESLYVVVEKYAVLKRIEYRP